VNDISITYIHLRNDLVGRWGQSYSSNSTSPIIKNIVFGTDPSTERARTGSNSYCALSDLQSSWLTPTFKGWQSYSRTIGRYVLASRSSFLASSCTSPARWALAVQNCHYFGWHSGSFGQGGWFALQMADKGPLGPPYNVPNTSASCSNVSFESDQNAYSPRSWVFSFDFS
jgi:hypothetical protein